MFTMRYARGKVREHAREEKEIFFFERQSAITEKIEVACMRT